MAMGIMPLAWTTDEAPAFRGVDSPKLNSRSNLRVCIIYPRIQDNNSDSIRKLRQAGALTESSYPLEERLQFFKNLLAETLQ